MKRLVTLFLSLAVSLVCANSAVAESKWTPISDNDYIFGFTSYKYACWSGVTAENPPVIEVFTNNIWNTAVQGQILPAGSDVSVACEADFPIAVGYVWTVMSPAPPAYQTNRYTALYRQKIPDKEITTRKRVTTQVYEDQLKCCKTELTSKKIPYIAKVKKNGKYVNVIKYKTVKTNEEVFYTEKVLVDQSEWQNETTTVKGWTGQTGNISIYSSVSAMNNEIAAFGNAILCNFGFSTNCKK